MSGRKTINDFLSEDLIDITQLLTLVLGQNKDWNSYFFSDVVTK